MTEIYNPFTGETVEFSKAGYGGAGYADSLKGTPMIGQTKQVGMLLPTGKHVGHGNDLKVIRHGRRKSMTRYGDSKLQRFGRKRGGISKSFEDLGDLSRQPGMVNPGVETSSWSHGTPNQNFATQSGKRGRKIS